MLWFVLALGAAFFSSLENVFMKISTKSTDPILVAFASSLILSLIFTSISIAQGIPSVTSSFWLLVVGTGVLSTSALLLLTHALKMADFSITQPLLTISPIALLVAAPLILGEFPSLLGLAGLLCIVVGAYTLHARSRKESFFAPFRALSANKGAVFALLVAILWGVGSALDKVGVRLSTPFFWPAMNLLMVTIYLAIILLVKQVPMKPLVRNWRTLLPVGLAGTMAVAMQMYAITLTIVPYVIAVKRVSALFGIFWAATLFREKNIKKRFFGAMLMVAGVALIAFS